MPNKLMTLLETLHVHTVAPTTHWPIIHFSIIVAINKEITETVTLTTINKQFSPQYWSAINAKLADQFTNQTMPTLNVF